MSEMTAHARVQIARHPQRPGIKDYIDTLFPHFFEMRGDRLCGEDGAILGGVALYHGQPVTVIGTRKGRTLQENLRANFGMPSPEGYRKALRLMKQAEKFRRPIITLIDTSGAYPGMKAEEHGQGEAIARSLYEMSALTVPVIAVISGEGNSGGALGVIGAGGMRTADELRGHIRRCRALTDKPFGVNIMLMNPSADEFAKVVIEERVPVVTTGAGNPGNPGKYIPAWNEAGIKVIPVAAAREAIADAHFDVSAANADRCGVAVSSGIGGFETTEEAKERGMTKGYDRVSPFMIPCIIGNMAAGRVAIDAGFRGMCTCPVTACAGGGNAVGDAFHYIRDGYAEVMLCGGTEASVTPLAICGFTSMKALHQGQDPARASIPFDAERSGLVMGEGAAVLLLEELEHAKARGGVSPEQVDYINAHGTSTALNDAGETAAVKKAFGAHAYRLMMSSTKSMTGHMLGAAGAVEAAITALALYDGFVPATINYRNPVAACDLDVVPNAGRRADIAFAMSNSLGFGGHNVSLVLRKWEA